MNKDHPVWRIPHPTLTEVLSICDAAGARTLQRASSIAQTRAEFELEIDAASNQLPSYVQSTFLPTAHEAMLRRRKVVSRHIGMGDLYLACLIDVHEFGLELLPDPDINYREQELLIATRLNKGKSLDCYFMRPLSHLFAYQLSLGTRISVPSLISMLPSSLRFQISYPTRSMEGLVTTQDVLDELDIVLKKYGVEKIKNIPLFTFNGANPFGEWAASWLEFELRVGGSVDLITYLAAGLSALHDTQNEKILRELNAHLILNIPPNEGLFEKQEPKLVLDRDQAESTACALLGIDILFDWTKPFNGIGPALIEGQTNISILRKFARALRKGQDLPKGYEATVADIGEPLMRDLFELEDRLILRKNKLTNSS